jgi:hypothetical protein
MKLDKPKYPEWQILLQEAMSESDQDKLPAKIHRVEALIFEWLQQLESSNDGAGEREAINDALDVLRSVKRERLQFPDWK